MIKTDFELWSPIKGYKGYYEVSTWGRVRSIDRFVTGKKNSYRKGKLLSESIVMGYSKVKLKRYGKSKMCSVHRLVAETFISNPYNKEQVNHINEFEKTNNRVDNLEWATAKENVNYGTHNERVGKSLTNRKDQSKIVYQYNSDYRLIHIWPSAAECGRNGFNKCCVKECCNGTQKTHKGYLWSYKELQA